jgi:hypothetical protein
MSRKLIALDLALAALLVWAGYGLRGMWRAAKERESKELSRKTAAVAVPPLAPLPAPAPVVAGKYKTIADQFLWDRSRNADVPVEAPPPPPPEPPMPDLPVYHGIMNLGDGPTAFLSATKTSPYEMIHPGENIGQFKLLSVNEKEIELQWHGKIIHKTAEELMDVSQTAAGSPPPGGDVRSAAPPAVAAVPQEPPSAKGPAEINQFGTASCQPNDTTPYGTVRDGMRKTQRVTPFATICIWEPVGAR